MPSGFIVAPQAWAFDAGVSDRRWSGQLGFFYMTGKK